MPLRGRTLAILTFVVAHTAGAQLPHRLFGYSGVTYTRTSTTEYEPLVGSPTHQYYTYRGQNTGTYLKLLEGEFNYCIPFVKNRFCAGPMIGLALDAGRWTRSSRRDNTAPISETNFTIAGGVDLGGSAVMALPAGLYVGAKYFLHTSYDPARSVQPRSATMDGWIKDDPKMVGLIFGGRRFDLDVNHAGAQPYNTAPTTILNARYYLGGTRTINAIGLGVTHAAFSQGDVNGSARYWGSVSKWSVSSTSVHLYLTHHIDW